MFTTVTVKMEAESKGELVDSFGTQVQTCREHFDSLKKEGVFGPPETVEMRYLVIGASVREPVQEHGTPDVE